MRKLCFGLGLGLLALGACGSDDDGGGGTSAGCTTDPWSCGPGQTCWVTPDNVFQCMAPGTKQKGASCSAYLGLPECAEELVCLQTNQTAPGTCLPYCDGAHPCAAGEQCQPVLFQSANATFAVCVGTGAGTDAGTDAPSSDGSAGGAGSAGAAGAAGATVDAAADGP